MLETVKDILAIISNDMQFSRNLRTMYNNILSHRHQPQSLRSKYACQTQKVSFVHKCFSRKRTVKYGVYMEICSEKLTCPAIALSCMKDTPKGHNSFITT